MRNPYKNEGLYIAGPECFYQNGYELWWAQRKLAEYYGIPVVLPTSTKLELNNCDVHLNAREIFEDLILQVKKTTAIIADLDFFRGSEPDGGTIFEMGWIWSKKGRIYGYTRDMRPMASKNQNAILLNEKLHDDMHRPFPYGDLPFCPSVVASSKLIEGDFHDALKLYISDLNEERKGMRMSIANPTKAPIRPTGGKTVIFFSGPERYSSDAVEFYGDVKAYCRTTGYEAVCPLDEFPGLPKPNSDDPYKIAAWTFEKNMALLQSADVLVANLEDFHGWEPNNDVSFECGAAYGMGKKCIAYMPCTDIMRNRIPHYGEEKGFLDWCGNIVENFNYPINLMFSCSMPIVQGGVRDAVAMLQSGL